MRATGADDIFVTGFNTPRWTTNLSFGNREIAKNTGFNIVWRWQESFLWESPLVTGTVRSYQVFDAQVTFLFPKASSRLKIGGANIFNKRYIQYAGGPTIGALYYAAVTFDGSLKQQKKQ
jgi:outer membrane receptor protein involved in Fe transport